VNISYGYYLHLDGEPAPVRLVTTSMGRATIGVESDVRTASGFYLCGTPDQLRQFARQVEQEADHAEARLAAAVKAEAA
jgi:hypothetical protein